MNVWRWFHGQMNALVEAGEEPLADTAQGFARLCAHGATAEVESSYPELLAAARRLELPWLEVFVRHWYLQFKLGLQNDVDAGLPEAVRLLEFAHRDECRECPQSVCAVQDLAIAYGMADGPAYAVERRQVCAETLERIDPSWPCFDCLSGEYGYALLDQGRSAETVEYLDAQARRLRSETGDSLSGYSSVCLACAHLEQGNPEAAGRLLGRRFPTSSEAVELRRQSLRSRVLAALGRQDRAREALPGWDAVRALPAVAPDWARAIRDLVAAEAVNPGSREARGWVRQLLTLARGVAQRGGVRPAFDVTAIAVELALDSEQPQAVSQGLELLRSLLPRLRQPCGADQQLTRLERRVRGS